MICEDAPYSFILLIRALILADAFFPEINSDIWAVDSRSEMMHDDETGYDFEFVVYVRR